MNLAKIAEFMRRADSGGTRGGEYRIINLDTKIFQIGDVIKCLAVYFMGLRWTEVEELKIIVSKSTLQMFPKNS